MCFLVFSTCAHCSHIKHLHITQITSITLMKETHAWATNFMYKFNLDFYMNAWVSFLSRLDKQNIAAFWMESNCWCQDSHKPYAIKAVQCCSPTNVHSHETELIFNLRETRMNHLSLAAMQKALFSYQFNYANAQCPCMHSQRVEREYDVYVNWNRDDVRLRMKH